MSKPRSRKKRPIARHVTVDWSPALGEMFARLAAVLDLTPPTRVKILVRGDRSTWTARYTSANGQPVPAVVRLKHLSDGSVGVLEERISLRFCATAAQLRGEG